MIVKRKLFGEKGFYVGGLAGLTGGALLGRELHAQYDALKAKHKYNPKEDADKEEAEAEREEVIAKSLREDKDYMKRFKSAKKKKLEVYNKFDNGEAEEWELDEADSKFDSEVPEGDVDDIEISANDHRRKAERIRKNPKEYRDRAAKDAKINRRLIPGIGAKVGGILGGVLGAGAGARL